MYRAFRLIFLLIVVVGVLDEHLAESIRNGTGLYFFLTLEVLILLHTMIRILTIYYKRFCWQCFKNEAMQCIEKVYKQGWFIKSIWQCRFCRRIEDVEEDKDANLNFVRY